MVAGPENLAVLPDSEMVRANGLLEFAAGELLVVLEVVLAAALELLLLLLLELLPQPAKVSPSARNAAVTA